METIGPSFLPCTVKGCGIRRIYSSPNTNDVNTQINQQIPEHTQHILSCQQNSSELEQIFRRKQRQGNTYWIAWSLGPRDGMNAWQTQRTGHQTIGTGSCVFLSLSLSLFLSLSELCAKNGQCLCARQNFNEGGRRW